MSRDCTMLISCSAGTRDLFKNVLSDVEFGPRVRGGMTRQWCMDIYSATARLVGLSSNGMRGVLVVELDFLSRSEMRAFRTLQLLENVITVGVSIYSEGEGKKRQALEAGCHYAVPLDELGQTLAALWQTISRDAVDENVLAEEIKTAQGSDATEDGADETVEISPSNADANVDTDMADDNLKKKVTQEHDVAVKLTQEELNVLLGDCSMRQDGDCL